jgi:hypothetical protein
MDLKSQMRKPRKSHLLQSPLKLLSVDNFLIMVSLGIFLVWILKYINLDFWYDELFSLDHFVLVPFWNIPTDYSYPNNHIFFNILNKIYLRFSIRDINILMDTPYVIRSLMLMYTLGVFIVLYQIAVLFYNRRVAVLSLIILMTTVPFYNFSVQVRGYILSTLLVLLLLYFVWRFDRIPSGMIAIFLVVSSSLLLYTIPSNLYFVLSILIIQGSLGLFAVVKKTVRGMKIREITQLFFGSTKLYVFCLPFR